MKWEVRVAGPDDLYRYDDETSALRLANTINREYLADMLKHPKPEDHVLCLATVHAVCERKGTDGKPCGLEPPCPDCGRACHDVPEGS